MSQLRTSRVDATQINLREELKAVSALNLTDDSLFLEKLLAEPMDAHLKVLDDLDAFRLPVQVLVADALDAHIHLFETPALSAVLSLMDNSLSAEKLLAESMNVHWKAMEDMEIFQLSANNVVAESLASLKFETPLLSAALSLTDNSLSVEKLLAESMDVHWKAMEDMETFQLSANNVVAESLASLKFETPMLSAALSLTDNSLSVEKLLAGSMDVYWKALEDMGIVQLSANNLVAEVLADLKLETPALPAALRLVEDSLSIGQLFVESMNTYWKSAEGPLLSLTMKPVSETTLNNIGTVGISLSSGGNMTLGSVAGRDHIINNIQNIQAEVVVIHVNLPR